MQSLAFFLIAKAVHAQAQETMKVSIEVEIFDAITIGIFNLIT